MSRARVERLAAVVAELGARRLAERAVPLAAAALEADGFRVHLSDGWGLSVDDAPGLSEKLAGLRAAGIEPPLVVVIRNLAAEFTEQERAQQQGRGPGSATGDASFAARPATSRARAWDPTTDGSNDV
jgi:hypothetical protein